MITNDAFHTIWFIDSSSRFDPVNGFSGLAKLEERCRHLGINFVATATECADTCRSCHSASPAVDTANAVATARSPIAHDFLRPNMQDMLILHTSNPLAEALLLSVVPGPQVILTSGDVSDRDSVWDDLENRYPDVRTFGIEVLDRLFGTFLDTWSEKSFDRESAPWWILEERSSFINQLTAFDLLVQGMRSLGLSKTKRGSQPNRANPLAGAPTALSWFTHAHHDLLGLGDDILPPGRFLAKSVPSDNKLYDILEELFEEEVRHLIPLDRSALHSIPPKLGLEYLRAACRMARRSVSFERFGGQPNHGVVSGDDDRDLTVLRDRKAANAFHSAFLRVKRKFEC